MKKIIVFALQFIACSIYCAEIEYQVLKSCNNFKNAKGSRKRILNKAVLKYMLFREACLIKMKIKPDQFMVIGEKFCGTYKHHLTQSKRSKKILQQKKEVAACRLCEACFSGNKVQYCVNGTIASALITPFAYAIGFLSSGCSIPYPIWIGLGVYGGALSVPCVMCGLYTCGEVCFTKK